MSFDLDRYYTPQDVARRALERIELHQNPASCVDSTCGSGRLLDAATDLFGNVRCIGIDRDKAAIRALRQRRPKWLLATGDLLSTHSYVRSFSRIIPKSTDLLIMNPPFSQGGRKHVDIVYQGAEITGSVAMAYILRSFELFDPRYGAVLIVPESLLFSDTDAAARSLLAAKYTLRKLGDLRSCTFQGARAHACIVQAEPSSLAKKIEPARAVSKHEVSVSLSRGCLPVHASKSRTKSVPFLHSTDIKNVASGTRLKKLPLTSSKGARTVQGWAVLVPRVGVPDSTCIHAVHLSMPVRLSDCVIAIVCATRDTARFVERQIRRYGRSFRDLYKGTGARYVTMSRLELWLAKRTIVVSGLSD
jgi:hypothetical protein